MSQASRSLGGPRLSLGLDHVALAARSRRRARPRRSLPRHEPGGTERESRTLAGVHRVLEDGLSTGARPDRRRRASRQRRRRAALLGDGHAAPRSPGEGLGRDHRQVPRRRRSRSRSRRRRRQRPTSTRACARVTPKAWTPSATTSARRSSTSTTSPSSDRSSRRRPRARPRARLFDGVMMVASTPGFYEIKRSRIAEPSFE